MSNLIKNCERCGLDECVNCEHSWSDIQKIKKQLEKKDKEIKELKYKLDTLNKRCHKCKHLRMKLELNVEDKLYNDLKEAEQQLEEKDKEINALKKGKEELCKYFGCCTVAQVKNKFDSLKKGN